MKMIIPLLFLFGLFTAQATLAMPEVRDQLSPELRASLSDKTLTEKEIYQGADNTQILYFICIKETQMKITTMYPEIKQDQLIEVINRSCEYSEDNFNIYSILLAASSMKKPMSEKQAAVFLEKNYKKHGRSESNHAQIIEIFKNLALIK